MMSRVNTILSTGLSCISLNKEMIISYESSLRIYLKTHKELAFIKENIKEGNRIFIDR